MGGDVGDGSGRHLGSLSAAATIAVGIVVGLLSTSIQSVGLTLQRKSHQLEDEKEDELIRRPPFRRRRWQIGMSMFVIANLIGSTIQITTLPLPVLSTLQASGLVFNTICASIVLHEPFTRWSFIGTALIAAGAILIALFGAVAEPSHNLAQHLELLRRTQFILWMVGTFILIACILVGILFINRLRRHSQPPALRLARGFAFGAISSILSAHALLIAKSAVELVVRTIVDQRNQFNRWQSWAILLLLVFFALSQLYFLHRGLKVVSTSVLYPFVFCVYNIIAILDGLIYFRQVSRLPALHAGIIAVGTVILLSGVLALSWRLDEQKHTAPPADAHTLLTPGMGIVEDTTTDDGNDDFDNDVDADNISITSADEEMRVSATGAATEHTPLLQGGNRQPRLKLSMPPRDTTGLHISKQRWHDSPGRLHYPHRRATAEAADIWDELQDSHRADRTPGMSNSKFWTRSDSPVSFLPRRASTAGLGGRRARTPHADGRDAHSSNSDDDEARDTVTNGINSRFPRIQGKGRRRSLGDSRNRSRTMAAGPAGATEVREEERRTPSTSLWRERDRERRRRGGWSGFVYGGATAAGSQRSVSTPLSAASRHWLESRPANGPDQLAGEDNSTTAQATETTDNPEGEGRSRHASLSGRFFGWFRRQPDQPGAEDTTDRYPTQPDSQHREQSHR